MRCANHESSRASGKCLRRHVITGSLPSGKPRVLLWKSMMGVLADEDIEPGTAGMEDRASAETDNVV